MFTAKRDNMVAEQIVARGVSDTKVLEAMRKVERHLFVPSDLQAIAYADEPLPIGHGQTISQPYIVAYMTEAAALKPGDRVLEIGTGSGYQAAVLADIVKEVYTIEVSEALSLSAAKRLSDLGYKNVHFRSSDGYAGWPEKSPFDAVIITAAPSDIPDVVAGQLNVGGRMVVPIGDFFQELCLITRKESGFERKSLLPVRFVPMIHRPSKH
ncbi:MAG: protein-L-isoaspartate(D-aspartate) O-methyltransferase [Candidatus Omnitrophica bacterium]|nr:protein-L-isoaspartate(D-aspartate) O-methyltransferase [Candidatus Omnitrophota bacterium]